MRTIKEILMDRDGLSPERADEQIAEARLLLQEYLDSGDLYMADQVCEECFGLEPDYLFELL